MRRNVSRVESLTGLRLVCCMRTFFAFLFLMVSVMPGSASAAMPGSSDPVSISPPLSPSHDSPDQKEMFAERTLVITLSTEDPCKKILKHLPSRAKGRSFTLKGVSLSGDSFFLAACQKMRADLEGAATSRLKDISGYSAAEKQFNSGVEAIKRDVYVYFLQFVALKIYDHLPADEQARFAPNSPEAMDKALEWLAQPENEIRTYVHAYLEAKAKPLARLFNDYMSGASMEIITGLQGLMNAAKDKFDRFTKMQQEVESGDTDLSDAMEKYGFSGNYLRKFKEYESRIKGLNKSYKIKDAVGIIAGAFQTDVPDQKIAGMMDLLTLVGGVAEDSNIPIVSLFGQIVKTYGEIGKEMLAKVLALEKMIRGREGFCIGGETHSLKDPKNTALIKTFGPQYEACPLELDGLFSNVFYQTAPDNDNNQLFFWDGKKFIKGRAGGGGNAGLRQAIRLIKEGERLNIASYAGKAKDIPTIAEVYNTPYPSGKPRGKGHSKSAGVPGLVEEAGLVTDAIADQIRSLRRGADPFSEPACTTEKVDRWIEKESGQRVEPFMSSLENSSDRLKTSYALAFVEQYSKLKGKGGRRTAAYKTYSRFFDKVQHLSMFKIRGWVLDENKPGRSCPQCAGARIDLSYSNARELPGCEIRQADAKGRFVAHLVTKSTNVSAKVSASVGNVQSETFSIEPDKLGLELKETPFVKSFSLTIPLKFEDKESEEGEDGLPGEDVSSSDIVGQLEAVAAQAESSAGRLQEACRALSGIGDAGTRLKQLEADLSGLRSGLNTIRKDAEQRNRSLAEIRSKANEASKLGESIIEFRKTAETKALFTCEQAELLQKKQGDPNKLIAKADAASREAKSAAGKAETSYSRLRKIADEAEAKSRALSGAGEAIRALQEKFQKTAAQIKSQQAQLEQWAQASQQAQESRRELPDLKTRAETLLAQGRSAAGEEEKGRLEAAFGRVMAATRQDSPCDEAFTQKLAALKETMASVESQLQASQSKLNSLAGAGSPDDDGGVKESVERIRAVADTGDVFAEAAKQSGADAAKCAALARSLVREGPDKLAGVARVAIASCEFKNAKGLLKQLGNDPRRAKLEALYFERVRHEGKTKTLFAQANQLFKDNQLQQALALLKEARGHTRCDKFQVRIDQAISKIEARMANAKDEEKPDQQQANASCRSEKAGSVAVLDSESGQFRCQCPKDRVASPDGKSCLDKAAATGKDTDLEPDEPETFAVAFRIYIYEPTGKPKTLEIPKGADSATRKRIKKQNEVIIENFAKSLSLSNTRPRAVTKMEVPMVIGFAPDAQETFPKENFAPGDRYSIPVKGSMPGKDGVSPQNMALLLEVIRAYDSVEEIMAAYPQMKSKKKKGMVNSKNISQAIIRDSSGTFTVNDPQSGKIVIGPLVKGWTASNKQKALQLTRQMILMAGAVTCFVATAVYEDPLSDQITVLRSFRDNTLLQSKSGTRLVRLYYKYGPGWAQWVKDHPSIAPPIQTVLDAGVQWLRENELDGTWQGDVVEAVTAFLDVVSSWFTDEDDYDHPASSGGLLNWLGL